MSFAVDVNVLLDAANRDSSRQSDLQRFIEERLRSRELFGLPWLVAMSFVRIVTDSRIFRAPLTPAEAMSNLEALFEHPQVQPVGERPGFLASYREVTSIVDCRGRLVPDAHLATILRQNGIRTLYTGDRDFRRFDFLDVRDPLEG